MGALLYVAYVAEKMKIYFFISIPLLLPVMRILFQKGTFFYINSTTTSNENFT